MAVTNTPKVFIPKCGIFISTTKTRTLERKFRALYINQDEFRE